MGLGKYFAFIRSVSTLNHSVTLHSFYIRSASQHDIYWHLNDSDGAVVAPWEFRTRYDDAHWTDTSLDADDLIIGTDDVFLITTLHIRFGFDSDQKQIYLNKDDTALLLPFSAFASDFYIDRFNVDAAGEQTGLIAINRSAGEPPFAMAVAVAARCGILQDQIGDADPFLQGDDSLELVNYAISNRRTRAL
ncbi:hypothetical protein FRB98_006135 [Tulasnella sp. 332]|nr:hypothetical protein FRB98_006135 [Tulasnella sp. 332]